MRSVVQTLTIFALMGFSVSCLRVNTNKELPGPTTPACEYTAPKFFHYNRSYELYGVNLAITTLTPSSPGPGVSYSVSPVLPAGMTLNTLTGAISGTPTTTSAETSYTITASNCKNSISTAITIAVLTPIVVDDTADVADSVVDGTCDADGANTCTLRAAFSTLTFLTGATRVIVVPAGTFTLGSVIAPAPTAATTYYLVGAGAATTIIQSNVAAATATYRMLDLTDTDITKSMIGHVTLRHGVQTGAAVAGRGGNIMATALTLFNCVSTLGRARNGGGVYSSSTFLVDRCLISSNTATVGSGGGLMQTTGAATITNSVIRNNTAVALGGGVQISSGSGAISIVNVLFSTNSVSAAGTSFGGGLSITNIVGCTGVVAVQNSTFFTNTSAGSGGGLYTSPTFCTGQLIGFGNNTFRNNTAATWGGGIYESGGTFTFLSNSVFVGNTASGVAESCNSDGSLIISQGTNFNDTNDCNMSSASGTDDQLSVAAPGVDAALADNNGTITAGTETLQSIGLQATSGAVDASKASNLCYLYDGRGRARSDGKCDIGAYEF